MGCACVSPKNKMDKKTALNRKLSREMSIGTKTIVKELNKLPNQYSFKKVLGHGAYGRVLLWESQLTNHQFAVKAITKCEYPSKRRFFRGSKQRVMRKNRKTGKTAERATKETHKCELKNYDYHCIVFV